MYIEIYFINYLINSKVIFQRFNDAIFILKHALIYHMLFERSSAFMCVKLLKFLLKKKLTLKYKLYESSAFKYRIQNINDNIFHCSVINLQRMPESQEITDYKR